MSTQTAAFFDLDGTLMPLPSLERRFFRRLRDRGEIPLKNYFSWLQEGLKLLPRGISAVAQENKMYLKSMQVLDESGVGSLGDFPAHKSGHQAEGQASTPPRGNPRSPVPRFFDDGIERLVCHAMLGHAIVMVSGTLEPLAHTAARALEAELAARGFATNIRVCATKLEEIAGKWTGRIIGEAMFGKAKARAVREMAEEMRLDLPRCWAYGDSASDRWMLAAVGHPMAVNPTWKLARFARKRDWPVLRWTEERDLPQRYREHRVEKMNHIEASANHSVLRQAGRCA
jgi:phosphoserine phosphatase